MCRIGKNDFQIGVERFVEMNRRYWGNGSEEITEGEKWIYVLHTNHLKFSWCMTENIVAKALQNGEKLPIASIISGRANDLMNLIDQVDESFGIQQRYCPSYSNYDSKEIRILAGKMASETYGNKVELLSLEYRGVRFGDVLYNEIIRGGSAKDRGKVFDCFSISQDQYYGHIRDTLAAIDQAYEIFEVKKPGFLVVTEYFYTKSLYAYVAEVLGATIIITSVAIGAPDIMVQINSDRRQLSDIKYSDIRLVICEKCLEYYLADDSTYKDFFVTKNECEDKIQIPEAWNNKRNVFILPHIIGDSPRTGCRHNFYHDYGEWFVETVKIAKDIPDVNWIIKDHPYTSYYGQRDYIRSIFEKYRTENMFWMDSECSGLRIKDVADCVLTCAGDAGIEYWAYGIPTITAGDAYYCNWGISYQMKTIAEYENILKNISNIPKPSEQSVEMSRKYVLSVKNWSTYSDTYTNLIAKVAEREELSMKTSGVVYGVLDWADQQFGKITRDFLEAFVELMKKQDLRESTIYQLKHLCTL